MSGKSDEEVSGCNIDGEFNYSLLSPVVPGTMQRIVGADRHIKGFPKIAKRFNLEGELPRLA